MSEKKIDKATVTKLLEVFDASLDPFIKIGLFFCDEKSEDYRNGYLAGTELLKKTVLGTLRNLVEEAE